MTNPWSKRIRALRHRLSYTQVELGAKIGAQAETICRWEAGTQVPIPVFRGIIVELEEEANEAERLSAD